MSSSDDQLDEDDDWAGETVSAPGLGIGPDYGMTEIGATEERPLPQWPRGELWDAFRNRLPRAT